MKTRISPGQFYASKNQEVVQVISYKAPTVRYSQASYGSVACKTTDAAFIENYRPISEERATELLRGPGLKAPKTVTIPEGEAEKQWASAEAHLRRVAKGLESDCGIAFGAVKGDLIAARQNVDKGNLRGAILHMKWAVEKLLPEGQQYCSQTLADDDPDKTIQGYLDNIVAAVSAHAIRAKIPKSDTPAIDAIFGDLRNCKSCGKPCSYSPQCPYCGTFH